MSNLVAIIAKEIIDSPEFSQILEEKINKIVHQHKYYSREELAAIWKVSKQTIDRMSEESLNAQGYSRKKIGVSVRFEKLPHVSSRT